MIVSPDLPTVSQPRRTQFKFIVDGQWKYDPHCQFEADAYNVLNNVVCVEPRSEGAGRGGSSLLVEPHKRSKSGSVPNAHACRSAASSCCVYRFALTKHTRHLPPAPHPFIHRCSSSWMSMPGEQARHKWERASAAMQRLAITRTDSQETAILALTPHERQQVANSLREFGLGPRRGSAAAAVAAAAAATATATAGHNGSAIHAEEKEGGLPPQQQQHVALPADGAEPALANGGGRQRPHAPGQHRRGRSTMASLGGSSASGSGSGSGVSSGASLASLAHVDDDMHMHIPPPLLKALTSKRGSQLHLASLLGEGSGLPPGRSRSMTDLDRMQQAGHGHGGHGGGGGSPLLATLRDTGSGLYALSSGGAAAAAAEGEAAGQQQQPPPPDACAAVGSCAVKSTSTVLREGKLILAMVGLPGRGKTHIARALRRHLEWMGLRVGYFNSSEYRRQALGEKVSPDFFDPTDAEAWQVGG